MRRGTAPGRRILRLSECTPQRPQRRAAQADQERGRDWQERQRAALARRARERGATLGWADASGRDSPCVDGRTWARRGRTPPGKVADRRFRLPRLAAMSPAGELDSLVRKGRVTAQEFLEQLGREAGGRILLAVDSASIHTAQAGRAWTAAHAAECEMHRQPPYAPPVHPVEQLQALVQRKVSRQLSRTQAPWRENPEAALRTLKTSPELVRAFFREADCQYILV